MIPASPDDFDHLIYEIGRATAAAAAVEDYFGQLAIHATGERKWGGAYLRLLEEPLERGLNGWNNEAQVMKLFRRARQLNSTRNDVVHSAWTSFPLSGDRYVGFRLQKSMPGQVVGVIKSAQQVKELADELLDIHAAARELIPMPLPGD